MKKLPALFCALAALATRAAETPKLNLLYITADDMNADSAGWIGSTMGATPVMPNTLRDICACLRFK